MGWRSWDPGLQEWLWKGQIQEVLEVELQDLLMTQVGDLRER